MTTACFMRSFATLATAAALPFGAAAAIDAHNTFDKPRAAVPAPCAAHAGVQGLVLELPPKSIVLVVGKP